VSVSVFITITVPFFVSVSFFVSFSFFVSVFISDSSSLFLSRVEHCHVEKHQPGGLVYLKLISAEAAAKAAANLNGR